MNRWPKIWIDKSPDMTYRSTDRWTPRKTDILTGRHTNKKLVDKQTDGQGFFGIQFLTNEKKAINTNLQSPK